MATSAAVWLVLLIALTAANLPFVNERLFVVGPVRSPKALGWRMVELFAGWGATLGVGVALEARAGQVQPQGWEFYVALGFAFLTFAFPGFVWRYLRRGR
ncbi:MAG: DUF2818 family protein [Pseudomonadota bacterium]|nr:DUF2818 family protein [Pseudomonadota bacterium]